MLKISTKGRYGLRVMAQLAKHYGEGPMLLSEISRLEDISLKYAEHLIRRLKPTKLLNSYRGANGGYELSKPPEKIVVRQIVDALEGKDYPVQCLHDPNICDRTEICAARMVWEKLETAMVETLENITLDELVD